MFCTMLMVVKDIDREEFYTNHKSCFNGIYNFFNNDILLFYRGYVGC